MKKELGKFLEDLRVSEGLSLREAAKRSGLSHSYIRDLELGINRKTNAPISPSTDTLEQLAKAYNYPFDKLLEKIVGERTWQEEPINPDIRSVARGRFTPEQAKKLRTIAETLFPEAFEKNENS